MERVIASYESDVSTNHRQPPTSVARSDRRPTSDPQLPGSATDANVALATDAVLAGERVRLENKCVTLRTPLSMGWCANGFDKPWIDVLHDRPPASS
jgi:hypothetical protein